MENSAKAKSFGDEVGKSKSDLTCYSLRLESKMHGWWRYAIGAVPIIYISLKK